MAQEQTPENVSDEVVVADLFPMFAANFSDGILVTRSEGEHITYANRSLERLAGYSPGELNGESLRSLVSPSEDLPAVLDLARTFFEENPHGTWVNQVEIQHKDGTRFMIEARTSEITHPVHGAYWVATIVERPEPAPAQRSTTSDVDVIQKLLDALPDGLVVVDSDGYMVRTNPATHALWPGGREISRMKVPEVPVWDEAGVLLPKASTPLYRGLREGVVTTQKLLHYRAPNGHIISTRASVIPLGKEGEEPIGVAMLLDDVTRAERHHARLAKALEVTEEAVLVVSRTGAVRYANHTARTMLGGEGIPLEVSVDVFFEPDSRELLRAALRDLPPGADSKSGPLRLKARETGGRVFSSEVHLASNSGVAGQLDEVTLVLSDVSDAEARLEGQRLLAEAGALLLGSLDPNRTIEHVTALLSRTHCDYFALDLFDDRGQLQRKHVGATRPENAALAQVIRDPPDPEGVPESREVLREAKTLSSNADANEAPWILTGSGEPARVARMLGVKSWLMTPLVLRGHVMGALTLLSQETDTFSGESGVVYSDLAQIAAVALDNAQRFGDARAAIDAREQLLRIVAHDLRSPLQSVRLAAELTVRKLDAGVTPDAAQVQAIGRAARRMDRLIADLLDWARIGGGKLGVVQTPVEVLPMMQEVMEAVRPSSGAHRVTLRVEQGLPRVMGDRGRLIQVLVNLASNALKFTPAGGRVALSASRRVRGVRFAVEDNGPGLKPDVRRRVFEPFYQREPGDHRGLGLGLTIASGLVRAHDSKLEVSSEPDEGSRFYFDLSAAKDA